MEAKGKLFILPPPKCQNMTKRKIPFNLEGRDILWLDKEIVKGTYASYSHAGRSAIVLLKKHENRREKWLKEINNFREQIFKSASLTEEDKANLTRRIDILKDNLGFK